MKWIKCQQNNNTNNNNIAFSYDKGQFLVDNKILREEKKGDQKI